MIKETFDQTFLQKFVMKFFCKSFFDTENLCAHVRSIFKKIFNPLLPILDHMHINPFELSLTSFLFSLLAGFFIISDSNTWILFLLISLFFDMLDGALVFYQKNWNLRYELGDWIFDRFGTIWLMYTFYANSILKPEIFYLSTLSHLICSGTGKFMHLKNVKRFYIIGVRPVMLLFGIFEYILNKKIRIYYFVIVTIFSILVLIKLILQYSMKKINKKK